MSADELEQGASTPSRQASCLDCDTGSARDEEDGEAAALEQDEEQDEDDEGPELLCLWLAPAPQPPTAQDEATLQVAHP